MAEEEDEDQDTDVDQEDQDMDEDHLQPEEDEGKAGDGHKAQEAIASARSVNESFRIERPTPVSIHYAPVVGKPWIGWTEGTTYK